MKNVVIVSGARTATGAQVIMTGQSDVVIAGGMGMAMILER